MFSSYTDHSKRLCRGMHQEKRTTGAPLPGSRQLVHHHPAKQSAIAFDMRLLLPKTPHKAGCGRKPHSTRALTFHSTRKLASAQQPAHHLGRSILAAHSAGADSMAGDDGSSLVADVPRFGHLVNDAFKAAYVGQLVARWPAPAQLPLVYSDKYNISFFGIEKLHPFDSCKFRKVINALVSQKLISRQQVVPPLEASREILANVHTEQYLHEIHTSTFRVVQVSPMKYHVAGTMLAAALAIERGWAVNMGGGMHHAYCSAGGGWCPFDDIMLAIRKLRVATNGAVQQVVYIDLDVHQGNGVERDKLHFNDQQVCIVDLYHGGIYPNDTDAMQAIDVNVPLHRGTDDKTYLAALTRALNDAHACCPNPHLVIYNAGTDILAGDPLGRFNVSAEGVVARDEMVWEWARSTAHVPIMMTLSGGYSRASAQVISTSLANILQKFKLVPGSKS